jgi:uncharacterized protein (TIGR02186 family)
MRIFFIAVIFVLTLMPAQAARTQSMAIDLAQDHVDVTTGFDGAHIAFYGVKEPGGALAVTLTGPLHDEVVRKKSRVAGVWINTDSVTFKKVPSFYSFASDRPERSLGGPKFLKRQGIGFNALRPDTEDKKIAPEKVREFQDALIRGKQARKLYPREAGTITYINDRFFKVDFYIPSNGPIGEYKVKAFVIDGAEVRDVKTTRLKVAQVGLSATVHDFAHRWSLAYGFLSVFLAMFVGWLSNTIRRTS